MSGILPQRQGYGLMLLPAFLQGLLLVSCGSSNSSDGYHVTPSGEYDKLKESLESSSRCGETSGYGCGTVHSVGSMARSSFVFRDLFVTCESSDVGFLVSARNSIVSEPTFIMNIAVYKVDFPEGAYACAGGVVGSDDSVAAESCDVSVQVHSVIMSATDSNQCLVKFFGTTPATGTVSCPMLVGGADVETGEPNYVSITGASAFTCPNSRAQ